MRIAAGNPGRGAESLIYERSIDSFVNSGRHLLRPGHHKYRLDVFRNFLLFKSFHFDAIFNVKAGLPRDDRIRWRVSNSPVVRADFKIDAIKGSYRSCSLLHRLACVI